MGHPPAVLAGRRAILFDLDGTLYCNEANRAYGDELDRITGLLVQERYGCATADEAYQRLAQDRDRLGFATRGQVLERCFGLGLVEQNRHRERHTHPERFLRPDPTLGRALDLLGTRFELLLGTNNTPLLARRVLAALGVDAERFRLLIASEDVGCAKPDPAFFRAILERSGFPPEQVLALGDRPEVDLVPAAALGMGTYLVRSVVDVYTLAGIAPDRRAS